MLKEGLKKDSIVELILDPDSVMFLTEQSKVR